MSPLGFKARMVSLIQACGGIYVTPSLRFASGVTPANLLVASMAAELSLPCTCEALVRLETGSYHAATHSLRSGRRFTD